jgi:polyferredoxin
MLKKIRIAVAAFFMTAITLLFLDFTGSVHSFLGWCAKLQFVPALFAVNIVAVAALILITLLIGRVYCSVICPLGIFQDVVSRLAGIGKKNRFSYRPPRKAFVIVRYALLAVFALSAIIGISFITVLLEPYSAYGRIVSQIFGPVYQWGNNILANFAERAGSYAFYSVDIWLKSVSALVVALLTFVIVGVFAWKSGRGYCNTVCPVGAFLGLLAKYSLIKTRIDKEKCANCGLCAKNCKSACIDTNLRKIDYSRCVACFNCLECCPKGGVTYTMSNTKESVPESQSTDKLTNGGVARRSFISGAVLLAIDFFTRTAAHSYDFDGGLAPLEDKRAPARSKPIIPPGADNMRNFRKRCISCQLCVSACPNQVLRASDSLSGFMQPHLSYERGYCRPECVKCSQVCPTGAIRPITTAEKSATQIGYAIWNKDLCIVNTDKVACDLCEHKCPTAAITMIPQSAGDSTSPKIPMIDTNRCIGCGACEQLCPARPYSAIYVDGIDTHRTI